MYYGPNIILSTGISVDGIDQKRLSVMLNIPLAAVNAIGTTVAVFVIDNLGRRSVMLRTLPGVLASLLIVSLAEYLSNFFESGSRPDVAGNYLAMVGLVLYLGFFSIGMSSTVWSVNTEIYPIHLVGTASSLATATNWFSNFLVSTFFLIILKTNSGKVLAFLILGGFTIAGWFFIYYLLPETKGNPPNENVRNILKKIDLE
jgi:SP family myo-inositol transporter-like MFS transporter 13